MDQALTNKKFIQQIDDVIETLGGTPVDLELTEDREDDMISNGVFVDKMDEVIEALGGTPSEIVVGDDKADDMVSDNIFQLKMEDVVKNMSGGGGGSSDFSTANVTISGAEENSVTLPILCEAGSLGEGSPAMLLCTSGTWADGTYPIALYKGSAYVEIYDASTSGNIENMFGAMYLITGDCTINFSSQ